MRNWLISLRNDKNLTAKSVADELGISAAYYSQIESGKRQKDMDITLVSKLSVILGVTVEQIIAYERGVQNAQIEAE